jgi:hypothetical protein
MGPGPRAAPETLGLLTSLFAVNKPKKVSARRATTPRPLGPLPLGTPVTITACAAPGEPFPPAGSARLPNEPVTVNDDPGHLAAATSTLASLTDTLNTKRLPSERSRVALAGTRVRTAT